MARRARTRLPPRGCRRVCRHRSGWGAPGQHADAVINKGLTVRAAQMDGQRYILMLLERMERAELVTEHMATHLIHFPKAPRATASSKTRRTTACAASSSRTAEPAALVYVNTLMLQDTTAHADERASLPQVGRVSKVLHTAQWARLQGVRDRLLTCSHFDP